MANEQTDRHTNIGKTESSGAKNIMDHQVSKSCSSNITSATVASAM